MPPLFIRHIYKACGAPVAGVPEIEAWGTLEGGDLTIATLKLGLFSYDITCLESYCAVGEGTIDTNCDLFQARGLDGHAFGVSWKADLAN